jgi:uncharacterized membrane protein
LIQLTLPYKYSSFFYTVNDPSRCFDIHVCSRGIGLAEIFRKSKAYLSHFLRTRGLWLIFLEFTVIRLAWNFDITYKTIHLLVIWALGVCMIWKILHVKCYCYIGPVFVEVLYPLIPRIGVMALDMYLPIFTSLKPQSERRRCIFSGFCLRFYFLLYEA